MMTRPSVILTPQSLPKMSELEQILELVETSELLSKAKLVAKGKSLSAAGIELSWMKTYGMTARRCRDDKDFGLARYPHEQGPSVGAFIGGFFEHRDWPLRTGMEKHQIMRPIYEYEANYINSLGYWMAFHEAAMSLSHESLKQGNTEEASQFDVWGLISIRYGLRVVGIRAEFYKMSARDTRYAKLFMPSLE